VAFRVEEAEAMSHPSLLIVDDDLGIRETFGAAFTLAGLSVKTVDSAANAIALVQAYHFDLLLVDFRMPGMNGTETIAALRAEGHSTPFVLMSAFATTKITVEAMKLGALDVLEKPLEVEGTVARILPLVRQVGEQRVRVQSDLTLSARRRPRSVAERWAAHVIRACDSEDDLTRIEDWARFVAISYSSLRENCLLLDILPHDARDFMRLLRAVVRSAQGHGRIAGLLNVSDGRTLKRLLERAGFSPDVKVQRASSDQFLDQQQFVSLDNEGLKAVRRALREGPPDR
jgi:DNA-binding response OmpR family regulator